MQSHDYNAYGEELQAGMLGANDYRKAEQKYSASDNVRQQYTGYERDKESGLDYAQARYYNSKHGRFTSVDPLTASASIKNPQTFNRYAYALNSPYKFTDPLGLSAENHGGGTVCHGGVNTTGGGDCSEAPVSAAPTGQSGQPQQADLPNSITTVIEAPRCHMCFGVGFDDITVTITVNQPTIQMNVPDGPNTYYSGIQGSAVMTFSVNGSQINSADGWLFEESVTNIAGPPIIAREGQVPLTTQTELIDDIGPRTAPIPRQPDDVIQSQFVDPLNSSPQNSIKQQKLSIEIPGSPRTISFTNTRTYTNLNSEGSLQAVTNRGNNLTLTLRVP